MDVVFTITRLNATQRDGSSGMSESSGPDNHPMPPPRPLARLTPVDETSDLGSLSATPIDQTTDFGRRASQDESKTSQRDTGSQIIGGYRLRDLLGQGGMGRVFRGIDGNGREIAVKLLSPHLASSPDALERFKHEGKIASQLDHPNCVFVHRVDEDRGIPYIAMELMSGETLKDLVQQRGPLPAMEAVRLILQCIEGLMEAHSLGMVHRDIKPANCYLGDAGNVKIGDFGLARSLVSDSQLTQTGAFLGTPLFASPEQLLGQSIDARSDIYSLSATLYYLLAGRAPFESPNAAQVIAKIASSNPPPFREFDVDVPKALETIVMRGLARDANARYQSFEVMRSDLMQILQPGREIASLGRRMVAGFIDHTLSSLVIGFGSFAVLRFESLEKTNMHIAFAISLVGMFLYFWLQEYLFSTTLGKRLLRLSVNDTQTLGRMSLRSSLFRTSMYIAMVNGIEGLCHLLYWGVPPFVLAILNWPSFLLGLGFTSITWYRFGRRQLTHEWLSGTETWLTVRVTPVAAIEFDLPPWTATLQPSDLSSPTVGRFRVEGLLHKTADERWYQAQDPQLERLVWIRLRSIDAKPVSETRRSCTRMTRMRFVESGVYQEERWEAFMAPEGVPLSTFWNLGRHLPWQATKHSVRELLREWRTTESDRIEDSAWCLERIFIDQCGRPVVTEVSVANQETPSSGSFGSVMRQIPLLALPVKHRLRRELPTDDKQRPSTPEELPSLSGMKFLEQLVSSPESQPLFFDNLESQFHTLEQSPPVVTSAMRLTHGLILTGFFIPLFALAFILASIGSVIIVSELRQETRNLLGLEAMLSSPEQRAAMLDELPAEQRDAWSAPQRLDELREATKDVHAKYQRAYRALGAFGRTVLQVKSPEENWLELPSATPAELKRATPQSSKMKSQARSQTTDQGSNSSGDDNGENSSDSANSSDDESNQATPSPDKIRIMGRNSELVINFDEDTNKLTSERRESRSLSRVVQSFDSWKQNAEPKYDRADGVFLWVLMVPILVLTIQNAIFRGGILQWYSGIAVAKTSGVRANPFQCLLRSALWYVPFVLVWMAIPYLEYANSDNIWWGAQVKKLLLVMPLVYLGIAWLWPIRGPHDRLVGTMLLPR